VVDGTGALLGTFLGTQLGAVASTTVTEGVPTTAQTSVTLSNQLVSFLDADDRIWTVGAGGGTAMISAEALFFESLDCSGEPLVLNRAPQAVFTSRWNVAGTPGVFVTAAAVPAPTLASTWGATSSGCSAGLPTPPSLAVYRRITRLGDAPWPLFAAPLRILQAP
jgi:hypothetical protein